MCNCTSTICSHPPRFNICLSSLTYEGHLSALMPSASSLLLIKSNVSGLSWSLLVSSRNRPFRFHLFLTNSWTSGPPPLLFSSLSGSSSSSPWPRYMSTPVTYLAVSAWSMNSNSIFCMQSSIFAVLNKGVTNIAISTKLVHEMLDPNSLTKSTVQDRWRRSTFIFGRRRRKWGKYCPARKQFVEYIVQVFDPLLLGLQISLAHLKAQ